MLWSSWVPAAFPGNETEQTHRALPVGVTRQRRRRSQHCACAGGCGSRRGGQGRHGCGRASARQELLRRGHGVCPTYAAGAGARRGDEAAGPPGAAAQRAGGPRESDVCGQPSSAFLDARRPGRGLLLSRGPLPAVSAAGSWAARWSPQPQPAAPSGCGVGETGDSPRGPGTWPRLHTRLLRPARPAPLQTSQTVLDRFVLSAHIVTQRGLSPLCSVKGADLGSD